ncbi:MAG: hypothetical protein ACLU4Q_01315 [Streptococcus thermophilus]
MSYHHFSMSLHRHRARASIRKHSPSWKDKSSDYSTAGKQT